MRVLFVANHNTGNFVPFVIEQADALKHLGIEIEYFGVHGKGITGYLSNLNSLKKKISAFKPDLVHAHYGLSGLLANLQRRVPVITTYHGSDIHTKGRNLLFSRITMRLSAYNIYVSDSLRDLAGYRGIKQCVLPCGIDTTTIYPMERASARKALGWEIDGKYVLFAGAFDNGVKNAALAKSAIAQIDGVHLMEMRGYSREQVNLAMNAANCLLMTSHREGSPQVIKEALACGTPIVSVRAGDVEEVTSGIDGCYIAAYDVHDIVANLKKTFIFQGKTNGPRRIVECNFSNELVAKRLLAIYINVLKMN